MSPNYYEPQRHLEQYHLNRNSKKYGYSAYEANHLSYSYRDESLNPRPEALPDVLERRRLFRRLRTFIQIGFILLPFLGAWALTSHYAATYSTYQIQCSLQKKIWHTRLEKI